jgi:type IV secretion system protein VirD4
MYILPKRQSDPLGVVCSSLSVALCIGTLSCWAATQQTAHAFGYQAVLGHPFLGRLYAPFAVFNWALKFDHAHRFGSDIHQVFARSYAIIACGSGIGLLFAGGLAARRLRRLLRHTDLHGSAHWATPSEVASTGLVGADHGVYVGAWFDPRSRRTKYLRDASTTHCLAFMPTGSGKTVGLVIPTLLSWERSAIVHDLKGEIWAKTAGWRAESRANGGLGQRVYKFEPTATDGSGVRLNPLDRVRLKTENEIKDVQNIVEIVADESEKPSRGDNRFWIELGKRLVVALILHVKYDADPHNDSLPGVAAALSDPRFDSLDALFEHMRSYPHDTARAYGWLDSRRRPTATHPLVAQIATQMLAMEERVKANIVAEAQSFLTLYSDPVVEANIVTSDFDLGDLRLGNVSLYLVIQPTDKKRLRPLTRLIVTQILHALMETQEQVSEPRALLMLDEVAEIGALESIPTALTLGRGYGIKLYVIAQDLSQLESVWGDKSKTLIANCAIRIASAPNDVTTADLLSKMCGTITVRHTVRNYSGNRLSSVLGHTTVSDQDTQRPLLMPDEVMRLPGPRKSNGGEITDPGNVLVFVAGHAPIYAIQPLYFRDPTFTQRAVLAAPCVVRPNSKRGKP